MKPYYQDSLCTLYLGDARDVAPSFTERGHVIMDPPYSAHVHSKSRTSKGRGARDLSAANRFGFEHLSAADRRALARHAARLAARWAAVFSDTESAHLWRRSLEALGLEYVRTAFWYKVGATPQFTGDRPAVACEAITLCHPRGRKRWNGGGKAGIYEVPIVLERGGVGKGGEPRIHTTQKPEALMIALVEDFTDPGDLVYDLTAGSCTTAIGCRRAKGGPRRFVGVERIEANAEKAARRLEAEAHGSTYHALAAGQLSLLGGR